MACINSSLSSPIFVSDLPSFGLIGLMSIGFILYLFYIITYLRNRPTSTTIYIYISQFSLLLILFSPITFLIRPSASIHLVCSVQTLCLQIFPFCLLLCYNVHFVHQWLQTSTYNSSNKSCLIGLSSFLMCLLAILLQTTVLLVWFYHHQSYQSPTSDKCTDECHRPLFLCSLSFNFFLLFLFSLQSSLRYHFYSNRQDFIYLLTSLLAMSVTVCWICLYLFTPLRSSWTLHMNNNSILAYGTVFFVYSFLGPLLFEQWFYQSPTSDIQVKDHRQKPTKMTFKSLSLTKEQQRAFMAAYIKRNLTASCENLTSITAVSSPFPINRPIDRQLSQTCHSTLSVDSLCPTLASTVSHELPAMTLPKTNTTTDSTSSCGTMASEYLLLSTPALKKNETK